jgi:hypothetical protein
MATRGAVRGNVHFVDERAMGLPRVRVGLQLSVAQAE